MVVVIANTEHAYRRYLQENKARWEGKDIRRVTNRCHLHGYHITQVIDITHSHHHYSKREWEKYIATKEVAQLRCEQYWKHRGTFIDYDKEYHILTHKCVEIRVKFCEVGNSVVMQRLDTGAGVTVGRPMVLEQIHKIDLEMLLSLGPVKKPKTILNKLERKLDRLKKREAEEDVKYNGNEMKLTFHAGFNSGYTKGRVSLLEDIIDDLKESGHER